MRGTRLYVGLKRLEIDADESPKTKRKQDRGAAWRVAEVVPSKRAQRAVAAANRRALQPISLREAPVVTVRQLRRGEGGLAL